MNTVKKESNLGIMIKLAMNRNFVLMLISVFLNGVVMAMTNPMFSSYASSLGVASNMLGLVSSIYGLATLVLYPLSSYFIDNKNIKWVSFIGVVLQAASLFLMRFMPVFGGLIVCRLIFGVGMALRANSSEVISQESLPGEYRSVGIGLYRGCLMLGSVIGPYLGQYIAVGYGYDAMFNIGTLVFFISALFYIPMTYKAPTLEQRMATKAKYGDRKGLAKFIDKRAFPACLQNILLSLPYSALAAYIVIYGTEIGIVNSALYVTVYSAIMVVMRFVGVSLIPKKGVSWSYSCSCIFIILSTVFLGLMPNSVGFYASAVCWGIGFSLCQSALTTYACFGVPREQLGFINGTYLMSAALVSLVGGTIAGLVVGVTSIKTMFLLCTIPSVIGFVLWLTVFGPRYNKQKAALEAERT